MKRWLPLAVAGTAALANAVRPRGLAGRIHVPPKAVQQVVDWYMRGDSSLLKLKIDLRDTPYAYLIPKIKAKRRRLLDVALDSIKEHPESATLFAPLLPDFRQDVGESWFVKVKISRVPQSDLGPKAGGDYGLIYGIRLPIGIRDPNEVQRRARHELGHALQEQVFAAVGGRGGGRPPARIRTPEHKQGVGPRGHELDDAEFFTRLGDEIHALRRELSQASADRRHRVLADHFGGPSTHQWLRTLRKHAPGKYRRAVAEAYVGVADLLPARNPRLPKHAKDATVQGPRWEVTPGHAPGIHFVSLPEAQWGLFGGMTQAGSIEQRKSGRFGIWRAAVDTTPAGFAMPWGMVQPVKRSSYATVAEAAAAVVEPFSGTLV